jgi:hypothetical protein
MAFNMRTLFQILIPFLQYINNEWKLIESISSTLSALISEIIQHSPSATQCREVRSGTNTPYACYYSPHLEVLQHHTKQKFVMAKK